MDELDAGDRQTLGENVRSLERETAGVLSAGVALMRLQGGNQYQCAAVVVDGAINVVVGQMAATEVGIIAQENITRAPIEFFQVLQAVPHRQLRDERQV